MAAKYLLRHKGVNVPLNTVTVEGDRVFVTPEDSDKFGELPEIRLMGEPTPEKKGLMGDEGLASLREGDLVMMDDDGDLFMFDVRHPGEPDRRLLATLSDRWRNLEYYVGEYGIRGVIDKNTGKLIESQPEPSEDWKGPPVVGGRDRTFMPLSEDSWRDKFDQTVKQLRGIDVDNLTLQAFVDEFPNLVGETRGEYRGSMQQVLPEDVGYFLSALIQNSSQNEFSLDIRKLEDGLERMGVKKVEHLGSFLREGKKVTFIGDVGNNTASFLNGGDVTVTGSTGNHALLSAKRGRLHVTQDIGDHGGSNITGGVELEVGRDAGVCLGVHATGGSIRVGRNAGNMIGSGAEGLTIHVAGDGGDEIGNGAKNGTRILIGGNGGEKAGMLFCGAEIEVGKDTGKDTGCLGQSGVIKVGGKIEGIASEPLSPKRDVQIFEAGQRVWPPPTRWEKFSRIFRRA